MNRNSNKLNFSWLDMRNQLDLLKEEIEGAAFISIESIQEDVFLFHLKLKDSQKTFLVSLKEGFLRFHLSKRKGKELSFSHPLNRLIDQTLNTIKLSEKDRILTLETQDFTLYICLIPKRGNLHLIRRNLERLYSQKPNLPLSISITFIKNQDKLEPLPKVNLDEFYQIAEERNDFELKKLEALKRVEKTITGKRKLIDKLNKELNHCQTFDSIKHEADLIKANLYKIGKKAKEVEVYDWKKDATIILSLDPLIPLNEELKKRYEKAKRLERGIPQVLKKIEKEELVLSHLKENLEKIKSISSLKELKATQKPDIKKEPAIEIESRKGGVFKKFTSTEGFEILVGTSAKNNDRLTFTIAKGKDLFFHAAGTSGAHVIVKVGKQPPGPSTLDEAALLAIHFSKNKHSGKREVYETECKFVRKAKGKPGAVFLMQKKTRWINYDEVQAKLLIKDFNS
ncbi:NFACT RNA binding domain-containing protein [Criblamydia sequanensis]|uniref:NFACT RNA-binding domain-containing protein n=1 Tax=Candidatus Criblamydia sequanensis CRIB-18 TaxID=1437425 RepID=A0A090D2A7_9BACT|nr:NFACT RNA binding domain-containing protein [Criblamydia sequanensis]CDR34485.1 hypothetical protein CSEC_1672 [Criblamydia sequanensis CRIB-18]